MGIWIIDVAKQYGFSPSDFERFMNLQNEIKTGVFSNSINENDIPRAVELYREKLAQDAAKKAKKEEEKRQHERAVSNILITSGFSFDGYKITEYKGYISGDDATQISRTGWFSESENADKLTGALVEIRKQAIKELREAAYDLDCNAVIGVDFDYITLEPQTAHIGGGTVYEPYVICVTANGTAVKIEKLP